MARTRKRAAPAAPLTVTRAALLERGSDDAFRALIHDLIAYGHRLDACRDAFAAIGGISGVQYEILMLVGRRAGPEGFSVGEVAAHLHRSGAFITVEAAKLVERGVLEKSPDPEDGRRVRLRLARKGEETMRRMAPVQQQVNDVLFECLDARRFRQLRSLARELVACGDRGAALAEFLSNGASREAA
jgi:DNA-binding MarR family transcriptional regulator